MGKMRPILTIWIFVSVVIASGVTVMAGDPPSSQDQTTWETNTRSAPAPPALRQALASALGVPMASGAKSIPTPPTGSWGIVSEGDGGGGIFRDSDSEAEAWLGAEEVGVHGFGALAGGHFADSDATGYAWVGHADAGIEAGGNLAGGLFVDSDDSGEAWVGHQDFGIEARGSEMGGYFEDSDGSGFAHLGWGDNGVFGRGNVAGGVFEDKNSSGYARVGFGDRGVEAGGSDMGGYFHDSDGSGFAHLGWGDNGVFGRGNVAGGVFEDNDDSGYVKAGFGNRGLEAGGTEMGGYFEDTDGSAYAKIADNVYGVSGFGTSAGGYFGDLEAEHSGHAYIGIGDTGVMGRGHIAGGVFEDNDGTGWAKIGFERVGGTDRGGNPNDGEYGIYGGGDTSGAYFENASSSSYGYVAIGDLGFWGFGSLAGGSFEDTDSGNWGAVGFDTSKVYGTGSVNFVQNHPYDPASVIVYAAPEGDEVATYTRGTAKLSGGEARVPLGKTFKWVTNPDIGLTAYAMPIGDWCDLYVAEKGTEEIVVRTRDGSDCTFDYLVYGLRIGFEESTIVQEKTRESYIPSMKSHRDRAASRPDLAQHTALSRSTVTRKALGEEDPPDLARAHALRDLIQEYDPEIHGTLRHGHPSERTDAGSPSDTAETGAYGGTAVSSQDCPSSDRRAYALSSNDQRYDADHDIYARSFRPSSQDLASLVNVSEPVEPGDVLVIDRDNPGMMRKAFEAHDTGVIGIVAVDAGVVLGMQPPVTGISNMHHSEIEDPTSDDGETVTSPSLRTAVALAGVVSCRVDANYGAVWPGDLLVSSPTPGHAMRADAPLPGTMLGKALEPLQEGVGAIKVLVMLR